MDAGDHHTSPKMTTENTAYSKLMDRSNSQPRDMGLPRIPLDLSQHKLSIALHWLPILLTSCILPLVGYFTLRYLTTLSLLIVLTPWLATMGVVTALTLGLRTWALAKPSSDCRPLGSHHPWALDYFHWNFLFGFVVLTIIISVGIAEQNLTVVSLPTSVLVLYVSLELLLVPVLTAMGVRAFFRVSSVAAGQPLRPAVYAIVEDIVAVDGKRGREFRQAWSDRYEASPVFRRHLQRMDLLWGSTGLLVVAIIWGIVFGVRNHDFGYAVGWALPFAWAGVMAIITTKMTKSMLRKERERARRQYAS